MKKIVLLLAMAIVFASLISCTNQPPSTSITPPAVSTAASSPSSIISAKPDSLSDKPSTPDPSSTTGFEIYTDYDNLDFSYLFDQIFYFSSGSGAWRTMVHINADGTFNGYYLDSDTSSQAMCVFSGKFTSLKKTSAYEYSMTCETLNIPEEVGKKTVLNGIPTTYVDPYGFDDVKEFKLYLPGKKLNELPLEFKQWVHVPWEDPENADYYSNSDYGDVLKTYGLYNERGKQGFSASSD